MKLRFNSRDSAPSELDGDGDLFCPVSVSCRLMSRRSKKQFSRSARSKQ